MLKCFLAASLLAVAFVLSVGVVPSHAECYAECDILVTPSYSISACVYWC